MDERSLADLGSIIHPSAYRRLHHSLTRTENGDPHDYRTPLYNSKVDREVIIDLFEERVRYTEFEELTAIDNHEKDKIGPFSIMLPAVDRMSNLLQYWKQNWDPQDNAWYGAIEDVIALLPKGKLILDSFYSAFNLMPKGTSLGLPWVTSDKTMAYDYLKRARSAHNTQDFFPAIWYWRGQSKGLHETPKQRDVWGMDHAETIVGATVLYPLLTALKSEPGFEAWIGDWAVDLSATRLLNHARGRVIISGDYSSFDSSLSRELLDGVDYVMSSWFVGTASSRISMLGELSATVPIVVPFRVLSGRNGGMPSGSVLTNMRDTIANLLASHYVARRLRIQLEEFLVLGDDCVLLYSKSPPLDELSGVMTDLGLEMNSSKQFISSTALHYLQRWHSIQYQKEGVCVGVHSPYRTLSGWLGYERMRSEWTMYMDSARWIMQTENCRHDPRFRQMVSCLHDWDKVLLGGMDPKEIFRRAGGTATIRRVLDIASFPFNVKNPELVGEFETTRLLREFLD